MLGGLALLALPVVAHLMHRRPRVYLVFPTLKLLREAVATTSRMAKLRRWLLLALRCLLVALVALAFAQPFWQSALATPQGQAAAVVLLVDSSASARQERDGVRFWHALQASAERSIGALTPGLDVVNVIEASSNPRPLLPKLTPNLAAATNEVRTLQPTFERADLPRALSLAGEQLARHTGGRRLVILSDLQRSNWAALIEGSPIPLPPGTQVTVVEPSVEPPDNVALSAPRAFPPQPLVKQPVQLVVRATNFSAGERQVKVTAVVEGRELPEQTLVLKPGEDRDIAFETHLDTTGDHSVQFTTTADGFPPDDQVALLVTGSERLPVLIVSDDLPTDAGSGTFFLARGLAPTSTPEDRFDVRQVLGRELATADLSSAGVVFVGYLGDLDEPGAKRLLEFVQQGGSAVIFCGEGSVARHLETLDAVARPQAVLPWLVGAMRRLDAVDDALTISAGKWGSRWLREFDESSQFALGLVRFKRPYAVAEMHPETEVLLSYSDSTPALGLRSIGTGRLLLANFSPSLVSSELGKHGVFVALVQVLAQELRPATETGPTPRVGETYRFPARKLPQAVARLEIAGPDGQACRSPCRFRANRCRRCWNGRSCQVCTACRRTARGCRARPCCSTHARAICGESRRRKSSPACRMPAVRKL